jgi:hypothetical protein
MLGIFLRIRMVFLHIVFEIPTPLIKHTRPFLTTYVLVLKFLKVILDLYGHFIQFMSSLRSRYGYGTGSIISGVKIKFMGKNK